MLYSTNYQSPIGLCTIVSDGESIVGIWLEGQKYFASTVCEEVVEDVMLPVLVAARGWLDDYFAGKNPAIARLPLAPRGSVFRQTVWKLLCEIPYGETITYGALADRVAAVLEKENMSARAVGGAVGHNPISIVIPCHRVVGFDGSLTGYAGGVERKRWLLELERM